MVIRCLYATALRNFELRDLKIEDFDFKNLRIVNKVKDGKGGKKGDDFRITKQLLADLRDFLGERKSGWLFLSEQGNQISERTL